MLLKPTKNNLLVQFFPPASSAGLVLPDGKNSSASNDRIKCKVLAYSEQLRNPPDGSPMFPVDTFLLLRPQFNHLIVDEASYISLIDASVVEAIVLDDKE